MMAQAEITFEFRTTWIMLPFKLFAWLQSKPLLRLLDNAIFARIYVNGELKQEIRLPINKMLKDYECQT